MASRRLADILLRGLRPQNQGKTNWVTVGICFLLAVTLWFLVTLNTQVYTTTASYPVKVSNVPQDVQLSNPVPEYLEVGIKGVGIQLLYEKLEVSRDTVYIDFAKYPGHYSASRFPTPINRVMPEGLSTTGASPDSISLQYDRKARKRVPVILKTKVILPETYRYASPITISPDSVDVVGPADQLEKIEYWNTVEKETEPVFEASELSIALDTVRPFQVLQKKISVKVDPKPYTEAEVEITVRLINIRDNRSYVRIEPQKVKIRYLVPMELYSQVDASDFRVVIKAEKLNPRSNFAIPEVTRIPQNVEVVSIEPPKLSYMIIDRPR